MLPNPSPTNGIAEDGAHQVADLGSAPRSTLLQSLEPVFDLDTRYAPQRDNLPGEEGKKVELQVAVVHEFCAPGLSLVRIHWHFLQFVMLHKPFHRSWRPTVFDCLPVNPQSECFCCRLGISSGAKVPDCANDLLTESPFALPIGFAPAIHHTSGPFLRGSEYNVPN